MLIIILISVYTRQFSHKGKKKRKECKITLSIFANILNNYMRQAFIWNESLSYGIKHYKTLQNKNNTTPL